MQNKLYILLAVNMLFIQCYTYAQCTAFYRTYQYGLSSDGRDIVELPDTSYIVVGQIHLSMSFPNWGGIALKLNNCGDTIWSKIYIGTDNILHNIEPYDSDKVVVFSAQRDSITCNLSTYNFLDIDSGYICCLNSFVNASNAGIFQTAKRLPSGKYYCTIDPFLDPLHSMNLVDDNMQLLYSAQMPGIGYTTIPVEDNDGNIYFASNTSFTWPYYVVCKYDSALNQQWLINTGTYFTNDPLEDLPSCSGIVFTNDSNLMVSSTGLDWQLMKVNRFTGDTIWTKYLLDSNALIGNPPYHVILTLTKTISGKYLATTEAGKLLYIDDNGNVLTTTIISATVLSLYNVIPTMDGGIIAVGTQYFGINGGKILVIKIDSLGNTVFTSVVELGNQTEEIIVYPNPAFKELAISNAQWANKAVIVNAYDVLGKQKLQQNLTATDGNLKMDVSSLVSGIYFLRVEEKGKVYNAKFLKE